MAPSTKVETRDSFECEECRFNADVTISAPSERAAVRSLLHARCPGCGKRAAGYERRAAAVASAAVGVMAAAPALLMILVLAVRGHPILRADTIGGWLGTWILSVGVGFGAFVGGMQYRRLRGAVTEADRQVRFAKLPQLPAMRVVARRRATR
jgi:hypothetical protein